MEAASAIRTLAKAKRKNLGGPTTEAGGSGAREVPATSAPVALREPSRKKARGGTRTVVRTEVGPTTETPPSCWENNLSSQFDKMILTPKDEEVIRGLNPDEMRRSLHLLKKHHLRAASFACYLEKYSEELTGLPSLSQDLETLRAQNADLSKSLEEQKQRMTDKEDRIKALQGKVLEKEQNEGKLKQRVELLEKECAELSAENRELTEGWSNSVQTSFQNAVEQLSLLNPDGLNVEGLDPESVVKDGCIQKVDVETLDEEVVEENVEP